MNTTTDASSGRAARLIRAAATDGRIARGLLEVVRSVERRKARVVFLAHTITRQDIPARVRALCREAGIPVIDRYSAEELAQWSGIDRKASAVAVIEIRDVEAFVHEAMDEARPFLRTLSGMQRVVRESTKEGSVDLGHTIRKALAVLETSNSVAEKERALSDLLRSTVSEAVALGIDLERVVDRWSLKEWLLTDLPRLEPRAQDSNSARSDHKPEVR